MKENRGGNGLWVLFVVLTLGLGVFYVLSLKGKGAREEVVSLPKVKKDGVIKVKGLSARGIRIVELLKKMGVVTVSDVRSIEKDVTNRTIRRDMDKLEALGIVEQVGNTRGSSYKYVNK